MRLLVFAVATVFALGCAAHFELVRMPGVPDPSLARDESALGIVRYQLDGDRADQRQRRSDAYLEMHDACKGPPDVVHESTESGWRYLHFRCVGPPPPHASDVPEDQKPCCAQVERPCGDATCTCDQNLCPQQ